MKGDWLMFGVFVIAFFVFTVLGACQQQRDAASTSDQQDVAAQSGPSTVAEISEQPEAQGSTMFATGTHSALPGLGTVEFPTSASSKEGQAHFVRGVAALHSFWYPVALNEFREATRMEPDFMMAYWGQAMAHNHPLWGDPQETQAEREVIEKIRISPELTLRERAWLNAVTVLYREGDKVARDKAYAEAMEKIYRAYPDDVEAALFYALALMESVRPEDPSGVQTRLRAGGIASQVF